MEVKIIITTQNYYVSEKGKRIKNNHKEGKRIQ